MTWGRSTRQRIRLAPLYLAIALTDRLAFRAAARLPLPPAAWRPGISVVIPDRDAPELLAVSLAALFADEPPEPLQVIVVTNGAVPERYRDIGIRYPKLTWVRHTAPLGFSTAIHAGLVHAQHDWTLLLNNDVELTHGALATLCRERRHDIFAIGAQILQRSADGRREETGFTDWYADERGVRAFHAPVKLARTCEHLASSGGASLFRTHLLRSFVAAGRVYDPFYWEDIEWSVRARRAGFSAVFCSHAVATHRHRATTSRFYESGEIDRIVERNRILFEARNAVTGNDAEWVLRRVCDLDYRSQRELASLRTAWSVAKARLQSNRSPVDSPPSVTRADRESTDLTSSFSFRLRARSSRRCLLIVTPFCVFPPRHGGARRIEGLMEFLRQAYDVVLLSDEASSYDSRSFAYFEGLHGVTLVRGRAHADAAHGDLAGRLREHAHPAMVHALRRLVSRHRPDVVQVEHAELASLSAVRREGERWVLALHDAYSAADFRDAADPCADRLHSFDGVIVCSPEDARLVDHPITACVPNGAHPPSNAYRPSSGTRIVFVGPFRYAPNLLGIRRFLDVAWPRILALVPSATLLVLGGDGAPAVSAAEPSFRQPGIEVLGHRDDVGSFLAASVLSINPLEGIRGSAVKLVESLMAGRVCVSTQEGARGFSSMQPGSGLVVVPDVESMADPIVRLLGDSDARHALERSDEEDLADFTWECAARRQMDFYERLLDTHG